MAAIYALTICLVLYAIGDIVSVKTKGLLSLVFVLCVVMLIGFWCGLPTDIVTTAGIAPLGKVSASLLVVGVGTTMNTKELIRQWKTVIASFCCCAAGVLLIVFVGRFIIGTDATIAGAPIFAGASVALMIVNEALENVGLPDYGRVVHGTGFPAPQRAVQAQFLFPAAVLHPDDHLFIHCTLLYLEQRQ